MDDELEENIESSLRESEEIQLYPNPTVGLLEIVGISSESVDVQVFNNLGVLVFSETVTGNTFNIEALSSGIYHVILSANGLQYKMKVLKK